jgi:hypothetical protein
MSLQRPLLTLPLAALLLAGCTENAAPSRPAPPPLKTEPIGLQVTRAEPRFAGLPFRVLLDFERPTDLAFVAAQSAKLQLATDQAHTGLSSLQLDHGGTFDVKLPSLLTGVAFPGQWTLAGAYFHTAAAPATVSIAYRVPSAPQPLLQRTVPLAADKWTPVFLDLTPLANSVSAGGGLLTFSIESRKSVRCDDVLVVNNTRTLVDRPAGALELAGWTIRQSGAEVVVDRPARFRVALKTTDATPDGWIVDETCDCRARFSSPNGRTWTIYADGRQYVDGQFSPLAPLGDAAPIYAAQHASPADLIVADEFGRIDRDTPGDRNNDGYNERRGSYELVAKSNRFEVAIKPNTPILANPVLEISGLPPGNALVTVEGQLIERTTRLPNGNLLIAIPLTIDRTTSVNVTVR